MKVNKIYRILTFVITLVPCVLAVPLAFHQHQFLSRFSQNSILLSIALFLACFLLMILAGWVKKIR